MLLVVSELPVLSELVELSFSFAQDVRTPAIAISNNIFFIIDLFFPQHSLYKITRALKWIVIACQMAARKNVFA